MRRRDQSSAGTPGARMATLPETWVGGPLASRNRQPEARRKLWFPADLGHVLWLLTTVLSYSASRDGPRRHIVAKTTQRSVPHLFAQERTQRG